MNKWKNIPYLDDSKAKSLQKKLGLPELGVAPLLVLCVLCSAVFVVAAGLLWWRTWELRAKNESVVEVLSGEEPAVLSVSSEDLSGSTFASTSSADEGVEGQAPDAHQVAEHGTASSTASSSSTMFKKRIHEEDKWRNKNIVDRLSFLGVTPRKFDGVRVLVGPREKKCDNRFGEIAGIVLSLAAFCLLFSALILNMKAIIVWCDFDHPLFLSTCNVWGNCFLAVVLLFRAPAHAQQDGGSCSTLRTETRRALFDWRVLMFSLLGLAAFVLNNAAVAYLSPIVWGSIVKTSLAFDLHTFWNKVHANGLYSSINLYVKICGGVGGGCGKGGEGDPFLGGQRGVRGGVCIIVCHSFRRMLCNCVEFFPPEMRKS